MNKKKSLVFFGNERIASGLGTSTPIIKSLISEGYSIEAIVANHEKSRSRSSRELEIQKFALEKNIPFHLPSNIDELVKLCATFDSEAAILVAYGRIIPQSVLDKFRLGVINIHPSLLPRHRGSTPIESVILKGEKETGVSLMKLVEEMDAGPLYVQTKVHLKGNESKFELSEKLMITAEQQIRENLSDVLSGIIKPVDQNNDAATYDGKIQKSDGVIDWSKSAIQIEREIRAYLNWPKSRTIFGKLDCVITKGTLLKAISGNTGDLFIHNKKLAVHCGSDSLIIDSIKPSGKKEMGSEAFLAGYKTRLSLTKQN